MSPNYLWSDAMLNVFALIGAYFALLVALSLAARPARARLAALARDLSADYPDNDLIQSLCRAYVISARSLRAAPVRFFMYVAVLVKSPYVLDRECEAAKRENPDFFSDPRILEMGECYQASTSAASPIFGALGYVARRAFLLKARIHHRTKQDSRCLTELVELQAVT